MDYHRLLYTLERIKAACPDKFGTCHTHYDEGTDPEDGPQELQDCLQLERDGLIRRAIDEPGQIVWVLNR